MTLCGSDGFLLTLSQIFFYVKFCENCLMTDLGLSDTFQPYQQMLCMLMQSMQVVTFCTKYNTFNAMYVYAVDGNVDKLKCIQCHVCQCSQCKVDTHTFLLTTFLIHSIAMYVYAGDGLECCINLGLYSMPCMSTAFTSISVTCLCS